MNDDVPALEALLGFHYASDVRGASPFLPVANGAVVEVPQLPTTLPTLDELLALADERSRDPIGYLTSVTRALEIDQVFTLHAELEGGAYLSDFERLLVAWRNQGHQICDLGTLVSRLDVAHLPTHEIVLGRVKGRAGVLALQGPQIEVTAIENAAGHV
jgi:hypothetical protein